MDYERPPDEVFFSTTILYKDQIVGSQRQQFNLVDIRVGDYLPQLSDDENSVQVKISVYDPNFFVPSVFTFQI